MNKAQNERGNAILARDEVEEALIISLEAKKIVKEAKRRKYALIMQIGEEKYHPLKEHIT